MISPGHPPLTDAERSEIRFVPRIIRPCQRPSVQYAFPDNSDEPVVFFALGSVGAGKGIVFTHVIGEANTYYAPWNGEVRTGPIGADDPNSDPQRKLGIQWDTKYEPCAHIPKASPLRVHR